MGNASTPNLLVRFRGTYRDFEELNALLTARFGPDAARAGEAVPVQSSLLDESELGQVEIVDIVIHFGVALAAHIMATQLHEVVRDFLRRHRSAKVTVEEPKG